MLLNDHFDEFADAINQGKNHKGGQDIVNFLRIFCAFWQGGILHHHKLLDLPRGLYPCTLIGLKRGLVGFLRKTRLYALILKLRSEIVELFNLRGIAR